jgi:outer membrane protein OmpA-like peptidoglycan-associated protein
MPMVDESMEEGWEKNRRVDFLIDEREDLKR